MFQAIVTSPNAIDMTAAQEAEQAGFDLSLVDESLRVSPEQRALQHQRALELALELEKQDNSCVTELNQLVRCIRCIA